MTDGDMDPVLNRAIGELRTLPPVDPVAVTRIVKAAAEARVSAPDDDEGMLSAPRWPVRWSLTVGLLTAAAVAGFIVRGVISGDSGTTVQPSTGFTPVGSPSVPARTAAGADAESMPIPKQFLLENATARRVSLVGDFNNWNAGANPLVRDPASGVWTVVVPIAPGRHVYAFMVNDSVLTLDPRAPKTRDPALGVEGSVVIVGKP